MARGHRLLCFGSRAVSASQVTPKDYLERALRPTKGSDPGVVAKNRIRQSITTLFPDRECFCLVRPVSSEKQLQNLDALPAAQLRPEFREVGPRSVPH
jgi:hypothetical protein